MTEPQPGPPFEERKYGYDLLREDAHRAHDNSVAFHTYTNQAAVESSNIALKTLIVINGGAAIAVLTFLGGVASKEKIEFATVAPVAYTIRYFAWGVALTMAGMAFSYLTHYFMAGVEGSRVKTYTHPYIVDGPGTPRMRLLNGFFHIAAVVAAFSSLVLFVVGMYAASNKIAHMLVK
jgi:hypothetical protein